MNSAGGGIMGGANEQAAVTEADVQKQREEVAALQSALAGET